jgi:hypothetical protein
VRQLGLPVGRDLAGPLGDGVDVGGERERDDLRLEPVDHRPRLAAGAAVRGLDLHRGIALRQPMGGEGLVDLPVKLARRIVAHVEQRRLGLRRPAERGRAREQRRRRGAGQTPDNPAQQPDARPFGRPPRPFHCVAPGRRGHHVDGAVHVDMGDGGRRRRFGGARLGGKMAVHGESPVASPLSRQS